MTATSSSSGYIRNCVSCMFTIVNLYLLMVLFFGGVIWYSVCNGGTVINQNESDVMYFVKVSLLPGFTLMIILAYLFFGYFEDIDEPEEVKEMRREQIEPPLSVLVHVDPSGNVLEHWQKDPYMNIDTPHWELVPGGWKLISEEKKND